MRGIFICVDNFSELVLCQLTCMFSFSQVAVVNTWITYSLSVDLDVTGVLEFPLLVCSESSIPFSPAKIEELFVIDNFASQYFMHLTGNILPKCKAIPTLKEEP